MKVCILMPTVGGVPAAACKAAVKLAVDAAFRGIEVEFETNERAGIMRSRDELACIFLGSGMQWSFWMDSDMVPPVDVIIQMLRCAIEFDRKILTGIYCGRSDGEMEAKALEGSLKHTGEQNGRGEKWAQAAYKNGAAMLEKTLYAPVIFGIDKKPCDPVQTVPFEVGSAGFGCMLVHRDVFAGMEMPYFRIGDEGEDVYFCYEARKRGHKIMALPSIKCGHIGTPQVFYPD